MKVLLAGATGAIGRPLILSLKQHGHSVFGLARSAESTRTLAEMGAEVVIGDALDAASVRTAIARIRPAAVINELTSLPKHYTPAEMKAAAERDSRVRKEGNVNLLAGMRESGVRRYVLQASGFGMRPVQGWLTNPHLWRLMLHPALPPAPGSMLNSNPLLFGNQK
jgi:nucleoside-diphosphate-sugar epimerase